jgi:hypothetical protein
MAAPIVPQQITATEFDGLLKQVYSSFRLKFFPIADPVLAQIKKGTRGMKGLRWSGRGVAFDTVMNRPVGVVANQEGWFPQSAVTTRPRLISPSFSPTWQPNEVTVRRSTGT